MAGALPRSYCCQYRETDLEFVRRLLAEEGLGWRVEDSGQDPGGHVLVLFADVAAQAQDPVSQAGGGVRFHRADATEADDTVQAVGRRRRLGAQRLTLHSDDYKASRSLAAGVPLEGGGQGARRAAGLESRTYSRGTATIQTRQQSKTILARTAGGSSQDHSGQFRSETWNGTIQMIQASPITGHGPGNFANTYGKYATVEWTGQAHNSYLQLASECGFPALLGLLLILVVTLSGQVRLPRKSSDAPTDVLASALPAVIIVAAARGLLDSESAIPGNALILWVAIGCTIATAGHSRFSAPGFGIAAILGLLMASGATG